MSWRIRIQLVSGAVHFLPLLWTTTSRLPSPLTGRTTLLERLGARSGIPSPDHAEHMLTQPRKNGTGGVEPLSLPNTGVPVD